jgi:hypothetical protein
VEEFNRKLNSMPYGISYSFSMPYPGWPKEQFDQKTQKELDRIASIDKLVDNMLTYPDAEAILNKIKEAK